MRYTTQETKIVDVVKVPSEIYTAPRARKNIEALLTDWDIVDFRPPGIYPYERFITAPFGETVSTVQQNGGIISPRFILKPKAPTYIILDKIWE